MTLATNLYVAVGRVFLVLITLIAIRMFFYWYSFIFHWKRYRRLDPVTTAELHALGVPYVKVQITTKGSPGSTEVILRGIENIESLVLEDPQFYNRFLSVEVVTESADQSAYLEHALAGSPARVDTLAVPVLYETPNGTKLKARGLHYAVEYRRTGWNRTPGKTFIVHYDEESVFTPAELRKLIKVLASTTCSVLEGPIYYPLEYRQASVLCRTMEANRPAGCFECRHVMESGVPLHLHGSNLVVDEHFENTLGWDIGCLDGQPFISEDYVFGMKAYLAGGPSVFGWHGCVMLEQPPFSVRSAFRQRYRWIFGVLQGITMARRTAAFKALPRRQRLKLTVGTAYRIATFALGSIVGTLSFAYLPVLVVRSINAISGRHTFYLPPAVTLWLAIVGFLWVGSVFIGAWYNTTDAGLTPAQRCSQIAVAVVLVPVAGVLEGSAGLWAVTEWLRGKRKVVWLPTPKTKAADTAVGRRATAA